MQPNIHLHNDLKYYIFGKIPILKELKTNDYFKLGVKTILKYRIHRFFFFLK